MNWKIADLKISPNSEMAQDVLSAMLGDIGFNSFEPTEDGLKAYIEDKEFSDELIRNTISEFLLPDVTIEYEVSDMEQKDWNEVWEQNSFDPILEREFDIRLNPKGAFGSGNHATTYQLADLLCGMNFDGKTVLDMGCGTGVLGIAMSKHGASTVVSIDIDELSVENTKENFELNGLDNYNVICGDASAIEGMFDVIVANIHKNIIIRDICIYSNHLKCGGTLLTSGFFEKDVPDVIKAAESKGLKHKDIRVKDDWSVVIFEKL